VVRDATEVQCIGVNGEPGGAELNMDAAARPLQGVCGGNTYLMDCRESLEDGSSWLRLAGTQFWVPESALRSRTGASNDGLPDC
jgi:hypothetical protein